MASTGRDINGSVPVWVHGGPGPRTVKEKVEPDPELFRNRFIGFRTGTINEKMEPEPYMYGAGPGLSLGR